MCREECEVQLLVSKVQPKYSPVPGEQAETSSCALHGKMGGCKEHTKKPHHKIDGVTGEFKVKSQLEQTVRYNLQFGDP